MTEHIDRDVSMNQDECEEEILDIFNIDESERDVYISIKCSKCGHIANVPDWLVGEFAEMEKGKRKPKEVSIECPKCNDTMFKSK